MGFTATIVFLAAGSNAFLTTPLRTQTRFATLPHAVTTGTEEKKSLWSKLWSPGTKTSGAPLTEKEIRACQANWAASIKKISKTYLDNGDFVGAAGEAAGELYAYGHSDVLFKPTKALDVRFRPNPADAMSYFVGAKNVETGAIEEDGGFAINGGKGFSEVIFDNNQIELLGDTAIAMGNYYFTCATTGDISKVEYTFGYRRCEDGKPRIFLHHSSVPFDSAPAAAAAVGGITKEEVIAAQDLWAASIKKISKACLDKEDFVGVAGEAAGELYAYGHSNVLFKPTKALDVRFRPNAADAMSYFVGAKNVESGAIAEDGGFAINGGKGFSDVVFTNHNVQLNGDTAIAMGTYIFTCATTGDKSEVEYTFGYRRCDDGKLRIFLHHSSVPYTVPITGGPVTKDEVLEVQKEWAASIARISKVYKDNGDFVQAAAEAAGNLYGYGHHPVMFKPTKAAEYQFRSTPESAMSYFVGGKNFEGGYDEDGGFAINGGKGWAKCVYENDMIETNDDIALAMGNYYFQCATTGDWSKVEYTFGYQRCADGKVRITLHHSSVPFSSGAPLAEAKTEMSPEMTTVAIACGLGGAALVELLSN